MITGAIAFASSCAYTLRDIKNTLSKLEEVPQTLWTLERKIALLSKVLSRLEGMVREEQDSTAFLQEDVVIIVLEGCHDTLERIHHQLQRLWPLGGRKLGKMAKGIMAFWKEGDIAQMVQNVEHEQSSLQFVMISHISLDSYVFRVSPSDSQKVLTICPDLLWDSHSTHHSDPAQSVVAQTFRCRTTRIEHNPRSPYSKAPMRQLLECLHMHRHLRHSISKKQTITDKGCGYPKRAGT